VGFVGGRVGVGTSLLRVFHDFPLSVPFHQFSIHIPSPITDAEYPWHRGAQNSGPQLSRLNFVR